MSHNIKQDYFGQVKKILDKVDKTGDNANHFRGIVLMGDKNKSEAYSWIHAPLEDVKNLVLTAMRNSNEFTIATAKAFELYDKELKEQQNNKDDENKSDNDKTACQL